MKSGGRRERDDPGLQETALGSRQICRVTLSLFEIEVSQCTDPPAGVTAEDRKELSQLYKQFKAAHVFVQAVCSHSGDAAALIAGLKIPHCQRWFT